MSAPDHLVPGDLLQGVLDAATIGSLAASFAHDANNRLTVLLTGLDLLAAPESGSEERAAALQLATGAAQRLATEVQALLAASRAHRAPRVRIEVAAAVQRVRDALGMLAERPVPFQGGVPGELATEADPGRLELLLLHALRFAHHCGASAVALAGAELQLPERDPARPWLRKGRHCELSLTLHGAVLPSPDLPAEPTAGEEPVPREDAASLEFAAVAAIARSLRGVARAHGAAADTSMLKIYVPLAP